MTKSKWLWLKLAVVVVVLSGCVKAEKKNILEEKKVGSRSAQCAQNSAETSLVDLNGYNGNMLSSSEISAEVRDVGVMSEHARYSSRREYSLQMCGLADMRSSGSVIGQKFRIYSELDIHDPEVQVQADGCIKWQVTLPFAHFADAINLEVNFIFKSVKGQAYIHRKMMFNPWDSKRGGNNETYDYTFFPISEDLRRMKWACGKDEIDKALAGKLTDTVRKLEIGSVNIVPVQKNKQNFIETSLIGSDVSKGIDSKTENEALRLELNGNKPVQSLDMHLNIRLANLKVRLYNSSKINADPELTTGRYRIYAQLIATDLDTKGHVIISDKLNISNIKDWETSTMGVNAVLPISLVVRPNWGNLNLLLKVVPVDILGVEPFEGLYHLGRFNDIAGGKSPMFDLSEYPAEGKSGLNFSYDDYLKRSDNYKAWLKGVPEHGLQDITTLEKGFRRFLFSQLDVLFSRVMPGDTSTDRTIQYTVETCLTDNLSGARPGGGLQFEIETEDRGVKYKTLRQTNDLGCLTWVAMISHKYYHRENLVKKISKITYLGKDSDRPSYDLEYYINPWDEKFTFGRDARNLTPEYLEEIRKTQEVAPPTRLLITDFNYDATGFRYAIDRYMNMTVKKTVLLVMKPRILKYNSIVWGRSGFGDLRDGIYLMKVGMQKDYLDPMANKGVVITNDPYPRKRHSGNLVNLTQNESENLEKKQFLVVKETLVRVLGGQIVTPIEFEINDLRTLRIRSQMLIQIETIDEMLLRAALLANQKLDGLLVDTKSSKTVEIMDIQKSLDELSSEMAKFHKNRDIALMDEYLRMIAKNDELKKRMQTLLSTLDKAAAEKILAQINDIRGTGETAVSVDRNVKFQALNKAIEALKKKIQGATEDQANLVEQKTIDEKLNECKLMMSNLINSGHVEEGKLYDPAQADTDGTLCKTKIPKDELFYYLTSSGKVGSDEWFQALLTQDEFNLYKANLIRDDFTKPYYPDFDFSLLSNQGDERFQDDGKPRDVEIDQDVSGLPRRTFIGPVTFVLNGNGSALRPTDVLDEKSCNGTCESLGEIENSIINQTTAAREEIRKFGLPVNSSYENSPYFGSVEHFYKKQVNDLQSVNRGLKYQYHQEMKAFSQIGNFLEQTMTRYVSFGNKNDVKRLDYNCYAVWKTEMEESYRKWRTGEDLSFPVHAIPEKCYPASDRVMSLNKFNESAKFVRETKNGMFNARQNEKYGSIDIPAANFKEFAKNGLMSPKLSLEDKTAILHKMCYMLRRQLYPSNAAEFKKVLAKRTENMKMGWFVNESTALNLYLDGSGSPGAGEGINGIQQDCHELVNTFYDDVSGKVKGSDNINVINNVIAMHSKQLPLVVERRVRVLETSNRYLYKDGKTLNYSVGTGFSTSHSMSTNRGYKVDPLETIEKTLGNFGGLGKFVGDKAAKLSGAASGFLGSASGMVNFQWGAGESLSVSDGTSVGENTTLAAQISTLDIEISKWEKCTAIRFDENFILGEMGKHLTNQVLYNATEDIQALGYFLCSGDVDTDDDLNPGNKLRVRERYFYLTQIFNEGDMQDPGALANHPWMLQLRGMRDFGRFEKVLKKPAKDVSWWSGVEYMSRDLWSAVQLGSDQRYNDRSSMEVVNRDDVAKALDLMSESFNRVLPTFPGMYTFSDTPHDYVTGWPEK